MTNLLDSVSMSEYEKTLRQFYDWQDKTGYYGTACPEISIMKKIMAGEMSPEEMLENGLIKFESINLGGSINPWVR